MTYPGDNLPVSGIPVQSSAVETPPASGIWVGGTTDSAEVVIEPLRLGVLAVMNYLGLSGDAANPAGTLTAIIKALRLLVGLPVGTTTASVATLTLPTNGMFVTITGTVPITDIALPTAPLTTRVVLLRAAVNGLPFVNGNHLKLGHDVTLQADQTLALYCDGANWYPWGGSGSGSGGTIVAQDEGTTVGTRSKLNFRGVAVTATDDAGNDRINIDISGGSGGHTMQDEGSNLAGRGHLNFVGAGVVATDDAGNDATKVTVPGMIVQDEGSPLTQRGALDFAGAGVVASDDSVNTRTLVTIPGPAVQSAGVDLPNRGKLNFTSGASVTDDAGNDRTNISITGGGGSGLIVQDEGTPLTVRGALDFAGAGVTATDDAANGRTLVTIPGGSGTGVDIYDEGGLQGGPISILNFVGAGVTATESGGIGTVTIPGGGASDPLDLTERATPSVPAVSHHLLYVKSDGKVYVEDHAGVEALVGPATGGGGSGFTYTPPATIASAHWALVNSGGSFTATDVGGGVNLYEAAAAGALRGISEPVPGAGPWDLYLVFDPPWQAKNNAQVGYFLSDGTAFRSFCIFTDTAGALHCQSHDRTTAGASPTTRGFQYNLAGPGPFILHVTRDASNGYASEFSADGGNHWQQQDSFTATGYTVRGFYIDPNGSDVLTSSTLLHYATTAPVRA